MWTILLSLLKDNWKFIVVSLIIGSALAYVYFLKASRDHYKHKSEIIKIEFDSYKNQIKAQTEAFEESSFRLEKEANQKILAQEHIISEQQKQLTKRIKDDKGIRGISVPSTSVRLFNESTGISTTTGDSKGTSQETTSGKTNPTSSVDLSTIFEVMVENNLNHQQCINQVEGLQQWYNKLRQEGLKYENPS